ncbi:hypothetical protein Sango_1886200 [Sesamum angolense]|uniref:DUF4283 domain-containing protein n=1 Tax=Sesamum angolense TaxID=2727404 RepID=A0AAE1WJ47_9LAMI|nr:hypothetical protein Sango_1886200 [Sesamum angolense]
MSIGDFSPNAIEFAACERRLGTVLLGVTYTSANKVEEEGVDIPSVVGTGSEEDMRYMLVGQLLMPQTFRYDDLTSTLMSVLWPMRGMAVQILADHRFLLLVKHAVDRDTVLRGCLWTFDRNLIMLNEVIKDDNPAVVELNWCSFYIHVHGLPIQPMTREIAEFIRNRLGWFLDSDYAQGFGASVRVRYLRRACGDKLGEGAELAKLRLRGSPAKHYDHPRVELSRSRVSLDSLKIWRNASRIMSHGGVSSGNKMWTPSVQDGETKTENVWEVLQSDVASSWRWFSMGHPTFDNKEASLVIYDRSGVSVKGTYYLHTCLFSMQRLYPIWFGKQKGEIDHLIIELEKAVRDFWWHNKDEKRVHWVVWRKVRQPTMEGGLGLGIRMLASSSRPFPSIAEGCELFWKKL